MNRHVARLEIGELGGEIPGLGDDRTRGRAKIDAELARDDLGERRLAEAGRSDEQHMIERLAARLGRFDEHFEVLARGLLAGEIGQDRGRRAASSSGRFSAVTVGAACQPSNSSRGPGCSGAGCMVKPNRLTAMAQTRPAMAPLATKARTSPLPAETGSVATDAVMLIDWMVGASTSGLNIMSSETPSAASCSATA